MITYKLNELKEFAQEFVDGVATGDWLNVKNNPKFKKQINADEAQLEDADGNLMTAEEAKAFIKDLP